MSLNLPRGLALAGVGYLVAILSNLTPGNYDVAAHLALAGGGALLAALAAGTSAQGMALGLGAMAVARAWSATRGTLLQNWAFAVPAWVVALGLGLAAWAALGHARGARLDAARLRQGLGLAALATVLVVGYLATTGGLGASTLGMVLVAAGLGYAALDPAPTATAQPRRVL